MKSLTEPVLLALIAMAGVVIAPTLVVIVTKVVGIHTMVNSRLTAALDLNRQYEERERLITEEKYQLREQLALAKQLQVATEKLPPKD